MAITSVGASFTATQKISAASWTFTLSSAVASGNYVVAILATDNVDGVDGASTLHSAVALGTVGGIGGQAMTKIAEYTKSGGLANSGTTVSLWMARASQSYPATTTSATATFSSPCVAKAISAYAFGADNDLQVVGTVQTLGSTAATSNMTISGLSLAETLYVHGYSIEFSGAALTNTSGYVSFPFATTGGGSGNSNQGARGEWDIDTSTGSTSTLSDNQGAGPDRAHLFVALREVAAGNPVNAASVTLTGDSSLSGSGTVTAKAPAATLTGATDLTGSGVLILKGGAQLDAQSGLAGAGGVRLPTPALTLDAASGIAGSGALRLALPASTISGASDLTGLGALKVSPAFAVLSGDASLSGLGVVRLNAPASVLAAAADMLGAGALRMGAAGQLQGLADLAVDPAGLIVKPPSGGPIDAPAMVLAAVASLDGTGSLRIAAAPLVLSGASDFQGLPRLTVGPAPSVLSGGASLEGYGVLTLAGSGSLSAGASLAGNGVLVLGLDPVELAALAELTGFGEVLGVGRLRLLLRERNRASLRLRTPALRLELHEANPAVLKLRERRP